MSNTKIFDEIQYYLQNKMWEKAFQSTLKLDSINEKYGIGDRTPLLYFTYFHAPAKYIENLLQNGADVNAVDNKNNNAIFYALFMDKVEYIELLAKYGINLEHRKLLGSTWPNLNEKEKKELGHTALCYELEKKCRIEYVEVLLKNGADVNNPLIDKWLDGTKNKVHRIRPPLSVLLQNLELHKSLYLQFVDLLIKYGANISEKDSIIKNLNNKLKSIANVEDPIEKASSLGLYDVLKLLLDKHIEYNTVSQNIAFIWNAQVIAKNCGHYLIYNLIKDTIEKNKRENNLFPYNVMNFFRKVFKKKSIKKNLLISGEPFEDTKNDNNEIEKLRILIESSVDVKEYQYVLDILENIDIAIDNIVSIENGDYEILKTLSELLFVLEQKCYKEVLWALSSFFYKQPIEYGEFKETVCSCCPINFTEKVALGSFGHANPMEYGWVRNVYTCNQIYFLFAGFLSKPSKETLDELINIIDAVNNLISFRLPLFLEITNAHYRIMSEDKLEYINKLLNSQIKNQTLALLEICNHIKKLDQFSKLSLEMMFSKEKGSFKDSFIVEFEAKYPEILNKLLEFIQQYKFTCNENNKTKRIEQIFEKLLQYCIISKMSVKQGKLYCVDFILDNTQKGDFINFLNKKNMKKYKEKRSNIDSLTEEVFTYNGDKYDEIVTARLKKYTTNN